MNETKSSGIIYIEPSRLLFYSSKINKVIFQDFPPDTVSDLDIINKDKFAQILNFFIQNALQKATFELVLVFSAQTTFEKVLIPTISKDIDALFTDFSSLVPFEEVLSKLYKENKQIKAYAVNRMFYELVADCFAKNGSSVNLVLPLTLILEKSPELSNNFDLPAVASKVESLKVYNMIDLSAATNNLNQQPEGGKNKNRRTYILVGVFAVLLVFMIIFGYNTFFAKPKNTPPQQTQPTPTLQPENTTQPSPSLTPVVTEPVASKSSNI